MEVDVERTCKPLVRTSRSSRELKKNGSKSSEDLASIAATITIKPHHHFAPRLRLPLLRSRHALRQASRHLPQPQS